MYFALDNRARVSVIDGRRYQSFIVPSLSFRELMYGLKKPSFFLTNSIREAARVNEGHINPFSR
jgi:hypothetical protein